MGRELRHEYSGVKCILYDSFVRFRWFRWMDLLGG